MINGHQGQMLNMLYIWSIDETDWSSEHPSIDFQTTQEKQHYSSPGDGHHPLICQKH